MNKTSGMGAAIAFLLWSVILFLFAQWPDEPGVLAWIVRVLSLLSLLAGVLGLCTELTKKKESQ